MATDSNTGKDLRPVRKPYALKRTIHRIEYNGGEYVLEDIIERMSQGITLSQAITALYTTTPKAAIPAISQRIKKHPYFVAYKEVSLKLMHDKGAALQQNMLDLALNSRSDMVKFSATKDSLDRIYGESGKDESGDKPTMVFNFSFGDTPSAPPRVVIEGEQ